MSNFSNFVKAGLCSALWFGYSPFASGTVGTIPAVMLFVGIQKLVPGPLQTAVIVLALIVTSAICVLLGSWAESYWGRKDPSKFVLDEVAGFFLTVTIFRTPDLLLTVIWAFLATRFFDIIKPPPADQAQSAPAGWGILLDDLIASVYAGLFLHVLNWIFPWAFGSTGA